MSLSNILKHCSIAMLLGFLISCTPNHGAVSKKRCVNKLKRQLAGFWSYSADNNLYNEKKNTFHKVYSKKFQECLQNMPEQDLIKVFGIPTDTVSDKLFYRIKARVNMGTFVKLTEEGYYSEFGYFSIQKKDTLYTGEKNIVNYK